MFTLQPLNPSNRALSFLTITHDGLAFTMPPAWVYKLTYNEPLPSSTPTPPLAYTLTPSSDSNAYRLEGGLTATSIIHWLDDLSSMDPRSASVDLDTVIHQRLPSTWSRYILNHTYRTPFVAEVPERNTLAYDPHYELVRHAVLPQGTILSAYHLEVHEPKNTLAVLNRPDSRKARELTEYLCHQGVISPWLFRDFQSLRPKLASHLLLTPIPLKSLFWHEDVRPQLVALGRLLDEAVQLPDVKALVHYWEPRLSKPLPPSRNPAVSPVPLHLASAPQESTPTVTNTKSRKGHRGRKPVPDQWYQEHLPKDGGGLWNAKDESRFGGIWPLLFIGRQGIVRAIENYWGGYAPVMRDGELVDVSTSGGKQAWASAEKTLILVNTYRRNQTVLQSVSDAQSRVSPALAALSASSDTLSARAKDLLLEAFAKAGLITILDPDELTRPPYSLWSTDPEERRKRLVRVISPSMRGRWVIGLCRRCGGRVAGPWQTIAQGRYKSCGCGWASSHGRKGA